MLGFDGHFGDGRPDVVKPGRSGPVYCSHFSTRVAVVVLGIVPLAILALGFFVDEMRQVWQVWVVIGGGIGLALALAFWLCLFPAIGFDDTGFRAPSIGLEKLVEWHLVADLLIDPNTKQRALFFRDGSSVLLPPSLPGVAEFVVELNRRGIFARPM